MTWGREKSSDWGLWDGETWDLGTWYGEMTFGGKRTWDWGTKDGETPGEELMKDWGTSVEEMTFGGQMPWAGETLFKEMPNSLSCLMLGTRGAGL